MKLLWSVVLFAVLVGLLDQLSGGEFSMGLATSRLRLAFSYPAYLTDQTHQTFFQTSSTSTPARSAFAAAMIFVCRCDGTSS